MTWSPECKRQENHPGRGEALSKPPHCKNTYRHVAPGGLIRVEGTGWVCRRIEEDHTVGACKPSCDWLARWETLIGMVTRVASTDPIIPQPFEEDVQ